MNLHQNYSHPQTSCCTVSIPYEDCEAISATLVCCASVGYGREKWKGQFNSSNPPLIVGIFPLPLSSKEGFPQKKCLKSFLIPWNLWAIGPGPFSLQGEF